MEPGSGASTVERSLGAVLALWNGVEPGSSASTVEWSLGAVLALWNGARERC